MATIDEVYKLLKYRATKSGFNGTISPNDFNLIFPRAERRYFNNKYKTYLINQSNEDSLLPFKTDPIPITVDSQGKYTKLTNVLHVDSMRATFNSKQVEVQRFKDDRLGNKISSEYDSPSLEFPIYVEYSGYFQFYPVSLGTAILVYLKDFTPSLWAYTLVSGRPVYNSAGSVQPLWSDDDIDAIIYMAGVDVGLNMRDQMDIQVNDVKAKENQ